MSEHNETLADVPAAMRETLVFADRQLRMATEDDRYGDDLVYLVGCMRTVAAACRAALSAPPRNCDRPECATTKAAQNVWRKEDGGKTAYYEWLLATATEQKEENDGSK